MARQSRWQQFSDAFNSTYGVVTNTAQDFQAAGIMRNEFEDDEGNPLSGDALQRRRYSELADLRARYGDAEGAMGLRSAQENLRSTRFANDLNQENRGHLSRQMGPLTTRGMESEIAARDALTARRTSGGGGAASGGAAAPGTLAERQQVMRAQILGQVFGNGGAPAESAPEGDPTPARRTPPAQPSAPSTPSTPSALPQVGNSGGVAPNPASAPAPAAAAPQPTQVSTRGGGLSGGREIPMPPTPLGGPSGSMPLPGGPTQARAEGEQGLSESSNPADGVMSEGPASMSAPEQDDPVEIIRSGIENNNGGIPDQETQERAEAAASNQASVNHEQVATALAAVGDIPGAKAYIAMVDKLGELRANTVTRNAARLQANLDSAYRRGGTAGLLQVLDADNGPDIDVRLVENEDGSVSAVDFVQDESGGWTPVRTLATAPNADALGEELYMHGMDPASALEYQADKLENLRERVEISQLQQEVPGENFKERLLWQLERDPYNDMLVQAYAAEMGLGVEQVTPALKDWRDAADQRAIDNAAKGDGSTETPGGGSTETPGGGPTETPGDGSTEAPDNSGGLSGRQLDQAAELTNLGSRYVDTADDAKGARSFGRSNYMSGLVDAPNIPGAGRMGDAPPPSGDGLSGNNQDATLEKSIEATFSRLRANERFQNVPDAELREVAKEIVLGRTR